MGCAAAPVAQSVSVTFAASKENSVRRTNGSTAGQAKQTDTTGARLHETMWFENAQETGV